MTTEFDLVNKATPEEAILEYERLLNQNGSRRFHVMADELRRVFLYEIKPLQKKMIFEDLSADQALNWFKRHVKVVIDI